MWWLWPVAIPPRARSAGACSCWLTDSWSLGSWRRSPTRPSGGRSKGGHQAVGEETVVHPRGGSGVCVAHGGCARALRGALRSEEASRLLRRVALPDGGRETYALASKAWTPAALRLRLRAQGYGQHLCVLRAQEERMATPGPHRSTHGAVDFALAIRRLVDEHYPATE